MLPSFESSRMVRSSSPRTRFSSVMSFFLTSYGSRFGDVDESVSLVFHQNRNLSLPGYEYPVFFLSGTPHLALSPTDKRDKTGTPNVGVV